nr:hypothetical protein RKE32_19335 [Streptomyces sp. Li-HN-5-13]
MADVEGEQQAGDGGHPEEGEAGHGGDHGAQREGQEQHGDHPPPPGEQPGPPLGGAPVADLPLALAFPLAPALGGGRGPNHRLGGRLADRFGGGGPGGHVGGVGRHGGRGVGEGPVRVLPGGVLLVGGLVAEGSGRAPLHGRSTGQQADRGTEAFRRTRLVELVLPAEPHRHQIGSPGPYDDRVDKAATAHVSHGTGAGEGTAAIWRGVSCDQADSQTILPVFVTGRHDPDAISISTFEHTFNSLVAAGS